MTTRDPMFGRPVRAPYAGSVGHSADGASQERAERELESGISKHRQALILGFLAEEGVLGMTIQELSRRTGWHHGTASGALSVLAKEGDIMRLMDKREMPGITMPDGSVTQPTMQSIYVLPEHVAGREVATRRASSADRLIKEMTKKVATLEDALAKAIDERDRQRTEVSEEIETVRKIEQRVSKHYQGEAGKALARVTLTGSERILIGRVERILKQAGTARDVILPVQMLKGLHDIVTRLK